MEKVFPYYGFVDLYSLGIFIYGDIYTCVLKRSFPLFIEYMHANVFLH